MPQLNLAWWLFNFFLGWIALIIVFSILLNKNLISSKIILNKSSSNKTNPNSWSWN
uniref:ATP synthase F0 subunit 8 n=1 Tax=Poraniopsis inflata TaxID=556853 RepID=UPI0028FCBBA2|nr:ATP synthase F0 subunit 8 [Poraniopsis inflata]WNH38676.1 ATP synthase F0 subunit 8 [Poraniopsis inflata]